MKFQKKSIIKNIFIILALILFVSCKSDIEFNSFRPINNFIVLGNTSKWDSAYFDEDSNIVIPIIKDTFQIHFDIDKKHNNALIFSVGEIDTVGYLNFEHHVIYFRPKNMKNTYKIFDFKAKQNDSWTIGFCGPLMNNVLTVENSKHIGNEIIQTIRVDDKSLFPPRSGTHIKSFVVSSEHGITEMDIHVGWAQEDIKVRNTSTNLANRQQ